LRTIRRRQAFLESCGRRTPCSSTRPSSASAREANPGAQLVIGIRRDEKITVRKHVGADPMPMEVNQWPRKLFRLPIELFHYSSTVFRYLSTAVRYLSTAHQCV
jgi:hypothetical protein